MARIAKVLSYSRRQTAEGFTIGEVKCQISGSQNVTAKHYAPPGDDAHPIPGEYAALEPAGTTGGYVVGMFWDPELVQVAGEGERIIFSRSALGAVAARHHFKADGTHELNGDKFVAMAELVVSELDRVSQDITTLKSAIGSGFTAVGAGMAANGPAGKSAFDSAASAVPSETGDVASERLKTS